MKNRGKHRMDTFYSEQDPFKVRPHHLLCAVCSAAGCKDVPCGSETAQEIVRAIKTDPYMPLLLTTDLDIARAHYQDLYVDGRIPEIPDPAPGSRLFLNFQKRQADYADRLKDLEVMRRLGMRPNTVHPATDVVSLLFQRIESLEGICYFNAEPSLNWPECRYAREDRFRQVRGNGKQYSLAERRDLGELLEGKGMFSLLPIRSRAEMSKAKEESCRKLESADRLFILPLHLMCLLCAWEGGMLANGPIAVDNLFEVLDKMQKNPDISVTLVEGICNVCNPCSGYDVQRNLCLHAFVKNQLRNLLVLRKLGLRPGSTMKARELYELLFERIQSARDICGWGDMQSTSPIWSTCVDATSGNYDKVRERGVDDLFGR